MFQSPPTSIMHETAIQNYEMKRYKMVAQFLNAKLVNITPISRLDLWQIYRTSFHGIINQQTSLAGTILYGRYTQAFSGISLGRSSPVPCSPMERRRLPRGRSQHVPACRTGMMGLYIGHHWTYTMVLQSIIHSQACNEAISRISPKMAVFSFVMRRAECRDFIFFRLQGCPQETMNSTSQGNVPHSISWVLSSCAPWRSPKKPNMPDFWTSNGEHQPVSYLTQAE